MTMYAAWVKGRMASLLAAAFMAFWAMPRVTDAEVEWYPGYKAEFTVPLDAEGIEELRQYGGITEAYIGLWVPGDFDPSREWKILVVSTTWSSDTVFSAVREMNAYLPAAQSVGGWIVMAADSNPMPAAQDDNPIYRWATLRAGLQALAKKWPAARKWPIATCGFSGGAKRTGLLGGALQADGYTVIGMWMGGCNEDRPSVAKSMYGTGPEFLDVPIFLSSGDNDEYVTPEWRQEVLDSLEQHGFTTVRQEIYSGGHELCHSHVVDGLRWFAAMDGRGRTMATMDLQGGNGGRMKVEVASGKTMPDIVPPKREGYAFAGFFSGTNGLGTQYYSASGKGLRAWDMEGTAMLHAAWQPNACAVALDRQGGTGGAASVQAVYDAIPPAVGVPTCNGYDFVGYFGDRNGTGSQYYNAVGKGIRTWDIAGDTTLYAYWQKKADVVWGYEIEGGKAIVTNAVPARGRLVIPATLGGCPVGSIESSAFSGATNLAEVLIPVGVDSIGYEAFADCIALTSMVLPDGVKYLGNQTFYNCRNLESVTLPDTLLRIGWGAFYGCSRLKNLVIPPGVYVIESMAFARCDNLAAIGVAGGNTAFASVDGVLFKKNLQDLVLCPAGKSGAYAVPPGVKRIDTSAFYHCGKLASLSLPDSVEEIGNAAFSYCTGLESLTLPEGLTGIGNCLYGCTGLKYLSIPDSVEDIGDASLSSCSNLERLEVPGAWWGTDKVARLGVPRGCEVAYRGVEPLTLDTLSLAGGGAGGPYEVQLEAFGGVPPYAWSGYMDEYAETTAAGSSYSEMGTAQGWQGDDACWNLALPFAFPFFGNSYTNAKVNCNGAISFGNTNFTAYSYDSAIFHKTPVIAALWADLMTTGGGDIYVAEGTDSVTVQWRGTCYEGGAANVSATLHKEGKIVLKYGEGNADGGTIGLSAGDGTTMLFAAKSSRGSMGKAADIVFTPGGGRPSWLTLTQDGVLRGTPKAAGDYKVPVTVTDAKGMSVRKKITLSVAESLAMQTVVFDANGGKCGVARTNAVVGGVYGILPTPLWEGCSFLGWFSSADGGFRIDSGSSVPAVAERTLYAHWTAEPVGPEKVFAIVGFDFDEREATGNAAGRGGTLRVSAKAGTVFEIQQAKTLDGKWTSVKKFSAGTNAETKAEVEVPGGEGTGFFRAVTDGK